ncbi:hypothetical protein ScPMuIL_012827 [Solemya velum]
MSKQHNIQTIVQGEASESDDEDDATIIDRMKTVPPTQHNIVVSGEASESDEEIDTSQKEAHVPPLKVNTEGKGDLEDITNGKMTVSPTSPAEFNKPKYDTLLHRKLRERNGLFRRHIIETIANVYQGCVKNIHNTTLQLLKTQSAIQDTSYHMRLLTNDLFHLEDRIDIVSGCHLLPDINITVSK